MPRIIVDFHDDWGGTATAFPARTYHPEPDLDLFVLKISEERRLAIPREYIQALAGSAPEQATKFTTDPLGTHLWWPELDEGIHLDGMLEHRYGNDKWMAGLERRGVAA